MELIFAMNEKLVPNAVPPWTKIGKQLESRCRRAIFEFKMLDGVDKLAVALSGGKDSLTLLFLLKAILGRGTKDVKLSAIHVKGEYSCGASMDSDFLLSICNKIEVEYASCDSTGEKTDCYQCSRERRKLLFTQAKEMGISTIAFGHHLDDSINTFLMNVLHKAEPVAILPKLKMVDFGITIIRPLIYVEEEDIVAFAKLYNFSRIRCKCPKGNCSMRQSAKEVLAGLKQFFPRAKKNLALVSQKYGLDKAVRYKNE